MAYDPILILAVLGMFAIGLLGLVLLIVGVSWFVVHPREAEESLIRGKRGRRLMLCIISLGFLGVGIIPFTGLFLPIIDYP